MYSPIVSFPSSSLYFSSLFYICPFTHTYSTHDQSQPLHVVRHTPKPHRIDNNASFTYTTERHPTAAERKKSAHTFCSFIEKKKKGRARLEDGRKKKIQSKGDNVRLRAAFPFLCFCVFLQLSSFVFILYIVLF